MNSSDKVAFSWIEVILILLFVLLAMGIFGLAELGVESAQTDERQMIVIRGTAVVPQAASEVTVAAAELAGLEEALAAENVAQAQRVISLTAVPGLQTPQAELAAAETRIPLLKTEVAGAVEAVSTAELNLADKAQDEAKAWRDFKRGQQLAILAWAVGGTIFVLGLGSLIVVGRGLHRGWELNGYEVVGATAGLVALLYGYAAFDWVGVAVAAALVLTGLIAAAARWRRGNRQGETRP